MYLQIIYQHEALQMWEMIKQEPLQLTCVQVRYGVTKNSPYIPMEYNICTDKLSSAATYPHTTPKYNIDIPYNTSSLS